MNVLQVENLIRSYRKSVIKESEEDVKVLKGISFQVTEGEFVGIMGKSGCGKTTLLKTLGMIDKPTDGTIKFMGEDTSELYGDKLADIRNSKIGFIFQDFYLMDSLSVEENIMLPMIISKQNISKMIVEAKKYAEQFQIEHLLKKNPYELSGGEKQRVAICRALINNPDLKNLVRSYNTATFRDSKNNVNVLKGISFQVAEGEFVGIMGKSGCGKTTLLKTLGMIDKPTDGTIKFMGEDTSELYGDKLADIRNSKIGFIFQDFYLMDSLSVEENIMLPMIISKQNINKMIAEAKKYAEQFQIEHLLKKNPYELSGGEKQRVAICRALINNPDLILADEPTGNLDSKSGKIVIDALNKISSEYKKTIVMVTHDPQMASYCSRLILLKDGVILEDLKNSGDQETFYQEILGKMKEL